MNSFGIPMGIGQTFVTLAFASFALTSLDSATRIGRYLVQELGEYTTADGRVHKTFLTNPYIATAITVWSIARIYFLRLYKNMANFR